jgi:hypothetical protein
MQELTWSETVTEGQQELYAVLPQPPTRLGCYLDAAVIAFPTPDGDEPLPLPQVMDMGGRSVPEAVSALKEHTVLPAAIISQTERFLWDFRRTIGDLFADNNYGRLAQRCHEDGIGFSTEPYGGPFEQLVL